MLRLKILAIALIGILPVSAYAATPAFSVHKNGTSQTVTAETSTKLTWSTEAFDTNTNFASDRFTPTIAGKYLIIVSARCAQPGMCIPSIYKNGTLYAQTQWTNHNFSDQAPQATAIIDMNGTTDYVEAFIYSSGTIIGGTADRTYFSGSQIDGAGSGGGGAPAGSTGDIQFNTGGAFDADTGQLFWDKTNNRLGIGTSNPTQKLHISGSGAIGTQIQGTTYGFLNLLTSSNSAVVGLGDSGSLYFTTYESLPITFHTNSAERMRISETGNVGIGTTSPVSKLSLGGVSNYSNRIALYETISSDFRGIGMCNPGTSPDYWGVCIWANQTPNDTNAYLFVKDGGNVGIGTTSPGYPLQVASGSAAFPTALGIMPTTHATSRRAALTIDDWMLLQDAMGNGTKNFGIWQSGVGLMRMAIGTNGNVGVGTTTPSSAFHVYRAAADSQLQIGTGANSNFANIKLVPGTGSAWTFGTQQDYLGNALVFRPGGVGTETVAFGTNGNVGIGTATPTEKLEVSGAVRVTGGRVTLANAAGATQLPYIEWYRGTTRHAFLGYGENAGPAFGNRMDLYLENGTNFGIQGGNVGINVTAPSYSLDVNGTVRLSNIPSATGVGTVCIQSGFPISYTGGNTCVPSDARLKERIEPLSGALDAVMKLRGVSYYWNEKSGMNREVQEIGFIAQEVEKVVPQLVTSSGEEKIKAVAYDHATALLVEAVKELKAANDSLKADNDNLRAELDSIHAEIEMLKARK